MYCEALAANDLDAARDVEGFVGVSLADLYKDWGELWPIAFTGIDDPAWTAWFEPRRHLFIDQVVTESVSVVDDAINYKPQAGHVLLDIPLAMTRNDIEQQVRDLLKNYRRADYKAKVIPAKYQLYKQGIRGENLNTIESIYFILKNETGNKRQNFNQFIADNGIGAAKAPIKRSRDLLSVKNTNEISSVWDRQWVHDYRRSKKVSYGRYEGIGYEYSWAAIYGYFPCKLDWLQKELANKA